MMNPSVLNYWSRFVHAVVRVSFESLYDERLFLIFQGGFSISLSETLACLGIRHASVMVGVLHDIQYNGK